MSGRKIRPPKKSRWEELFRLTDEDEWVPDDGEPGVAFYGRGTATEGERFVAPLAFCYGTARQISYPDVQRSAMTACCDRYGCANGRRVDGRGRWS